MQRPTRPPDEVTQLASFDRDSKTTFTIVGPPQRVPDLAVLCGGFFEFADHLLEGLARESAFAVVRVNRRFVFGERFRIGEKTIDTGKFIHYRLEGIEARTPRDSKHHRQRERQDQKPSIQKESSFEKSLFLY